MEGRWPDTYSTPYPADIREEGANWRWLSLWEQENPRPEPSEDLTDYEHWYSLRRALMDRIWVAWSFPQFKVFDWSEDHVSILRDLIRSHVCSVCGRSDDPGCTLGC